MRKEGIGITSSHIESAAFQHWRAMYTSFASNPIIDNDTTTTSDNNKEVALAAFNGTCNRCGKRGHKEAECYSKQHINGQALGAKQGTNDTQQQNEQKQTKGQGKTKFKTCNYSSKYGHKEADCRKKKADEKKGNGKQETGATAISGSRNSTEFLLYAGMECGLMSTKNMFPDSYDLLQMPEIWIGNTAATTDMTPHRMGMTEVANPQGDIHVVMGNKQVEKSTAVGNISSIVCDNQGHEQISVKMTDVALVPDCAFNLFSLSKRLKKGWSLQGNADALTLSSPDGARKLRFDIKITTPNGVLFAIYMKRTHAEHANIVTNMNRNEKKTKMSVLQAHEKLGHINERATVQIADSLGWTLTGNQTINCASRATGKAKQKSLNKVKVPDPDDEKNWYRAYLDISTVKKANNMPEPPNLNWQILVLSTNVQLKFSHFFKSKNIMIEPPAN